MAQDTTTFQYLINSEYLVSMIETYQGRKFLDMLFMSGAGAYDGQTSDVLKMPTELITTYDGKAKVVRVPIMPTITGDVTSLAETNDASEISFTPGYCDITPAEFGKVKATITGKAQLQTYTSPTAIFLNALAAWMADTKERLIGRKMFAGGTKAQSEGADTVKYFQVGPVAQGGAVYKPDGFLTPEAINDALILLRDVAEPFDNGLLCGVIHTEQTKALKEAAGSELKDFQLWQSASPFPSNMRMGVIGVWNGTMWFETTNPYCKVASGAHDGTPAYKTALFGKKFMAKAYCPPAVLPLSDPSAMQMPFDDFVLRVAPDASDPHRRSVIVTPWFVGEYNIALRNAGVYIVAKSNFSTTSAASVA
jgi:hypothetical protein